MTNEKVSQRPSETRVIVPVTGPDQAHSVKYFILSEEPKGYICEKGCVHDYPSKFSKSRLSPETSNATSLISRHYTQTIKNTDKLKRIESPVAYRYIPPGQEIVPILEKNSGLYSTISPLSTETSRNFLNQGSGPISGSKSGSNSESKSGSARNGEKLPVKLIQASLGEQKSISTNQGVTQTHLFTSKGLKLIGAPSPLIRNSARHFLEPNTEKLTEVQEKEYDSKSDVFTRLYPYVYKPKELQDDPKLNVKMDWQNYHRLQVIYEFMDELETKFPSLCTVGVIGQSLEGREIKLLKISNGNANNEGVWIDAGIHAREWIGPAVNTYVANHIARNFDKLPRSVTNKDWYFCPVANPDGYEYSHTKNRMWRKNRACVGGKCVGVDLNRNFSVAWGGKGSSGDPKHCFYRGLHPFSEPESCALRDVLLHSQISFKVYITLHAFGEVIIFPLAHSDDLCPDYIRLLNGAAVMSRAIYNTNGTTYKAGVSKDVMYRASGTSNDWCYAAVGIPYCYLIELRSKKHKYHKF